MAYAHFSGCGWIWMDSEGNIQLMGTRNFTRRESTLHSEVEALRWAMENMLQHSTCESFGTDCKDHLSRGGYPIRPVIISNRSVQHTKEPLSSPSFSSILFGEEALTVRAPPCEQPTSFLTEIPSKIYPSPKSIYEILFGNEALDVEGRSRQASQPHFGAWASPLIFRGPTVRQVPMDALPDAGNSKLSISEEWPALTIDPSRNSRKQRAYMSSPQAASLADSSTPAFVLEYELRNISSEYHGQRRCVPNALCLMFLNKCYTQLKTLLNKAVKEIASSDARRLVSVTSFPAGNLPLDEVFASSLSLFIHVPISSFVLDEDFLHRTRGS
ncbi:hypothetical protein DY000_02041145 [Brassica cretica]|uniref:RNase H type-1 domain-containing protein n=1 Tax=Brassica cretica TaxID=69181 RepID=A0ABQ7BIL9_BRACR|nr:hypothetical protein DY000_02041145 [Brassica cretica]